MKITKSYLKQIIQEEINKLSKIADDSLDKETAEEFGVPQANKPVIDGIRDTIDKVKKIKVVSGVTDSDINAIIDMAPKDIKDIIRKKYSGVIKKDTIK